MFRKIYQIISIALLVAVLLAACAQPAAPTVAPAKTEPPAPTQAPAKTEAPAPTQPPAKTEAPVMTEAPVATEAPAVTGVVLPEVDPASLSGNIVMAGSSTVFPLAERMAELFKKEGFTEDKGKITIDSIGSGGGFERFCKTGETDISNASRKIKSEEVDNCKAIGREPIEFRIGTDAIAVVVSSENDFLTDVTKDELAKIFSDQVTKWNEVRSEWPAEDIRRFAPGTDSGTFDYFVEAILLPAYNKDLDAAEKAILSAANTQFSEDDNVLVQGVEGSPYAIGFFGFAYYVENEGKLKAISINGVTPTEETAESNEYPLSRPLFIYSDAKIMQEKPQVAAFINYFLTYVNDEIEDVGYFPASQAALDEARQKWLVAMGMAIIPVAWLLSF